MTSFTPLKPASQSLLFLSKVGLFCLIATTSAEAKTITIQPNDTLSDIIYLHYPNAANPLEIMRRVHANNPEAFVANNPNRLIVGKPLVLDDEAPAALAPEAQNRLSLLSTERQSLSTQLQVVEQENAELKRMIKRLETEQSTSIPLAPAILEENIQLKQIVKRFETEQKSYDATIQQLENKITTLNEKVVATIADPTQAAAVNELNTKLNNELKKARDDYATSQLQLKEARDLASEREQQLALANTELTTQQSSNKELNQALQEARELNSQLTLELQNKQQGSSLPWIIGGGAALLWLPVLWWVRRRAMNNVVIQPDTTVAVSSPPDALKVDTNLVDPLHGNAVSGFNEGRLKLNIARAYLDKRDTKAAAELLQEVLREGDETQKQQAREILSFIN